MSCRASFYKLHSHPWTRPAWTACVTKKQLTSIEVAMEVLIIHPIQLQYQSATPHHRAIDTVRSSNEGVNDPSHPLKLHPSLLKNSIGEP